MKSIFDGVKVVDLTKVFSGPFANRILVDYGAEVLKIESQKNFDTSRNYPPLKNGWSGYYEILNRNKKGIDLDLKTPQDLAVFYSLIKEADVVVENLTPSTKQKLKIDYETLKRLNPRLIYASLSGLGQSSDRKYYDVIAQAQSGLMSLSGENDNPVKIGPSVVDAFSGMTLAFAISSALFYREKTGNGQYLDVSMLACAMNLLESNLIDYSITHKNPRKTGNQDNAISPFGVYKAADGFIVVAVGSESLWAIFSSFLSEYTQLDKELFYSNILRLENNDRLTNLIEQVFAKFTVQQLVKTLTALTIPNSKVNQMSDLIHEELLFKQGNLVRIKHSKLGDCVVPGNSVIFSEMREIGLTESPSIGRDNDKYGI